MRLACTFLLYTFSATSSASPAPPQQVSLALHEAGATAMHATWVSTDPWTPASTGAVSWGPQGSPEASTAPATCHTYTAGFGWQGTVCFAAMTGLTPGAAHSYFVATNGAPSSTRVFTAAPLPNASATMKIGVLADMGSVELFGFTVAEAFIKEHQASPFALTLIAGDLSYATVDPPKAEFQRLWDLWGLQNENFSSTAPFMMTVCVRAVGGNPNLVAPPLCAHRAPHTRAPPPPSPSRARPPPAEATMNQLPAT